MKKTTGRKVTYSPAFERYLKELFNPAQAWSKTAEGKTWILRHIPTLYKLIQSDYDSVLAAVYAVRIEGVIVYVGESMRTVRRLICHAYNLCHYPELFGMTEVEVEQADIRVHLLSKYIYDKQEREAEEQYYVEKLKPILQQQDSDDCIPRSVRRTAALEHIVERLELKSLVQR